MEHIHFVTTGDGSQTLYHAEVGEHYHSKHGAYQESEHVFLSSGLQFYLAKSPNDRTARVLEVGFGTGLNFLLTADYAEREGISLDYCGIEAYPLPISTISSTGYEAFVESAVWSGFRTNYEEALSNKVDMSENIRLHIAHQKVMDFRTDLVFDVVYFDAFAAIHQPEMWTEEVLGHIAGFLRPGGVFVTYAITGHLKRTMKALGFEIEKAPGAPGKREMLRALKK